MRSRRASLCLGALAVALLGGCGASGDGSTSTRQQAAARPQGPAKIPGSWSQRRVRQDGFSFGRPPHWKLRRRGQSLLLRSPDRLVALSLAVSRDPGAFAMPPERFVRTALASLAGYRKELRPGPPRPIGATPLQTAAVRAKGVAKQGGVRQTVEFAVLRHDHSANFTAVIAANARDAPHAEIDVARRILRSLRDQGPPRAQRSGRSG